MSDAPIALPNVGSVEALIWQALLSMIIVLLTTMACLLCPGFLPAIRKTLGMAPTELGPLPPNVGGAPPFPPSPPGSHMSKEEVEDYIDRLLTPMREQANMDLTNTKSRLDELAESETAIVRQADIMHNGLDSLLEKVTNCENEISILNEYLETFRAQQENIVKALAILEMERAQARPPTPATKIPGPRTVSVAGGSGGSDEADDRTIFSTGQGGNLDPTTMKDVLSDSIFSALGRNKTADEKFKFLCALMGNDIQATAAMLGMIRNTGLTKYHANPPSFDDVLKLIKQAITDPTKLPAAKAALGNTLTQYCKDFKNAHASGQVYPAIAAVLTSKHVMELSMHIPNIGGPPLNQIYQEKNYVAVLVAILMWIHKEVSMTGILGAAVNTHLNGAKIDVSDSSTAATNKFKMLMSNVVSAITDSGLDSGSDTVMNAQILKTVVEAAFAPHLKQAIKKIISDAGFDYEARGLTELENVYFLIYSILESNGRWPRDNKYNALEDELASTFFNTLVQAGFKPVGPRGGSRLNPEAPARPAPAPAPSPAPTPAPAPAPVGKPPEAEEDVPFLCAVHGGGSKSHQKHTTVECNLNRDKSAVIAWSVAWRDVNKAWSSKHKYRGIPNEITEPLIANPDLCRTTPIVVCTIPPTPRPFSPRGKAVTFEKNE